MLYTSYVDIDSAQQWLGVDNIKAYAESPEKMQDFWICWIRSVEMP